MKQQSQRQASLAPLCCTSGQGTQPRTDGPGSALAVPPSISSLPTRPRYSSLLPAEHTQNRALLPRRALPPAFLVSVTAAPSPQSPQLFLPLTPPASQIHTQFLFPKHRSAFSSFYAHSPHPGPSLRAARTISPDCACGWLGHSPLQPLTWGQRPPFSVCGQLPLSFPPSSAWRTSTPATPASPFSVTVL